LADVFYPSFTADDDDKLNINLMSQKKGESTEAPCSTKGEGQKPDPCDQDPTSEECRNKSSYEDALNFLKGISAKSYRSEYKISQDGKEIYRIDRSHNDIEVYNPKTRIDKGSIDPKTGNMYRDSQGKPLPKWVK
jgi:hypothetical protein